MSIFYSLDNDKDNLIQEYELKRFKDMYLSDYLPYETFEKIKIIAESETNGSPGTINLEGFLAIWNYFLENCRFDVIWVCLRKFGYDDSLGSSGVSLKSTKQINPPKKQPSFIIPWVYYSQRKKYIVVKCANIFKG